MSAQIALAEDVELVQQLESLQLQFSARSSSGNAQQHLQVVMPPEGFGVSMRLHLARARWHKIMIVSEESWRT